VTGFGGAVASLPLGAREKRPVIVATHGNFDHPVWNCQLWRGIVADGAFVLCPRGQARPDTGPPDVRYHYTSNVALEKEIEAGIEALRRLFPEHLDVDERIYGGFSQGAIMGVAIAGRTPARYPRMVLIEGGYDRITSDGARAYARAGGKRVLFACGQPSCVQMAKGAAAILERAGVSTKVVHGAGVGHGYHGAVAERIRESFPWLVEGSALRTEP
jgi:predicted esterase